MSDPSSTPPPTDHLTPSPQPHSPSTSPPPRPPTPTTLSHPLAPPTSTSPPDASPINPSSHPSRAVPQHPGGWLPRHYSLEAWLDSFHAKAKSKAAQQGPLAWHPVIQEIGRQIEGDPLVRMTLTLMIEQTPKHKPYKKRHINNIQQLLTTINVIIHSAPRFDRTELVGAPLNAVLDFMMGTQAGFAAFRSVTINGIIQKILKAWCEHLSSPASRAVLHPKEDGWLCPEALRQMKMEEFEHEPTAEHLGFESWNHFFTRRFRHGARPVVDPDNDKVIVSACESTPYAIQMKVKRSAQFWIKSQPYSLYDMLAGDVRTDQFVGGTVYQAFLSALFYHRWHSPVNGVIVERRNIPGTYYSEIESEGFDPAGPNNSQGYITHVATRALLFIQADDPVIGLMAVMFVGMAEISSCVFLEEIVKGARVKKGQEIGYFAYGGSTHVLLFRPGVIQAFMASAIPQGNFGEGPPAVKLSTAVAIAN